jgi:hypothetical protein
VNDIETGAFEVDDTPMVAVDRLYEGYPDAQPWVIRIGHRAVFRMGSRSLEMYDVDAELRIYVCLPRMLFMML